MNNISNKLNSIVLLSACLSGFSMSANAVDGVILITQANALAGNITPGDTAGFPVTLSKAGSYQLASNLIVSDENTDAVRVTADNVTFNLNGFAILGPNSCSIPNEFVECTRSGSGTGVRGVAVKGITIINGTIRGQGGRGIIGGDSLHVENLTINSNGSDGILHLSSNVGGAIITKNNISLNGGEGIFTSLGSLITNNTVSFNALNGIRTSSFAHTVIGNTINGNTGFGLNAEDATTGYSNNVFFGNNGTGEQVRNGTKLGVDSNLPH